jgi:hypothetical protein
MSSGGNKDCDCRHCRQACEYKPGWFGPSQIAPLAAALNLSVVELFNHHLSVDWWAGDVMTGGQDVFVLSPRLVTQKGGDTFPADPNGHCHWHKDGKCAIHTKGKPAECAFAHHDVSHGDYLNHRLSLVREWARHQQMIAALLGREPASKSYGA